jgi:chromosome partitioning protein
MRRVVFNNKGGVGKSTIVCNLAAVSALRGKRTLVVDLDPQGNTTRYLRSAGVDADGTTLAKFFEETLSFKLFREDPTAFVHATPFDRLALLPSHPEMADLHGKLESHHKIYKLRELLQRLSGYDAVYLDTPPAMGFYTLSALIAADRCLIPFDCDDFSRQALYALLDTVQEVRADHNRELEVEGIVVNQFQSHALLPQRLVDELVAEGLPVLEPYLSSSVKVRESHQECRPLVHLAPAHKLARQYEALHDRLERKVRRAAVRR